MKIEEPQSAILTNHEVLTHVRSVAARYATHPEYDDKPGLKQQELHRILTDVTLRLTSPPTPLDGSPGSERFTTQSLPELVRRLHKFQLTKPEVVMLCNLRPKDTDALEAVVEEAEARYGQAKLEEIVSIVRDVLGHDQEDDEEVDR